MWLSLSTTHVCEKEGRGGGERGEGEGRGGKERKEKERGEGKGRREGGRGREEELGEEKGVKCINAFYTPLLTNQFRCLSEYSNGDFSHCIVFNTQGLLRSGRDTLVDHTHSLINTHRDVFQVGGVRNGKRLKTVPTQLYVSNLCDTTK